MRALRGLFLLSFLILLLTPSLPSQTSKNSDIAVVVHPDTPVSGLTLDEVRQVFRGERQYWNKSVPVVLIMRAPVSRERDAVLKTLFQMSDTQFKQYWVAKIFRAEAASGPKIVYSNGVASQLLAAVPGAIAFMDSKDVKPGLKVLTIDGKLPGDPKYPLR